MDPTTVLAKLYALRDQLLFFWQNPSVLKTELLQNRQLLVEVVAAIAIFILLLLILCKPSPQAKKASHSAPGRSVGKTEPVLAPKKTFSKALAEQKKEPALAARPIRPIPKKSEQVPVHELSEEEERALQQAMSIAGKQALAEVTGEPHQTEIFQNAQVLDAAKKIFAGRTRGQEPEAELVTTEARRTPAPGAFEFIMIYFMAPRSQAFEGEQLFAVLRDLGLSLNDQHVFEFKDEAGLQFYVASALKPGHFDIHRLHYTVPGLGFVLDLATISEPEAAFQKMLACIYELSRLLKGDILDEYRQRLTQANIHQYMARIKSFRK